MAAVIQLTGGLAHDLNNLLASMMGDLELLQTRFSRRPWGLYLRGVGRSRSGFSTFGWMTRWRRLVRDYEQRLNVSEAFIHVAKGSLLLRRIAN